MSDENVIDMSEKQNGGDYGGYIKAGTIILIILIIIGLIISNLFIVKEGEYKVVRQFGEVVRVDYTPGLSFKIPFIQTVTTLTKKQLIYDVEEAEINTRDKKRMIVDNYAVWEITDPKKMIQNVRTVESAEGKMGEFIFSVVRAELGRLNYDEIINDEKSSRGSLNDRIKNEVNEILEKNEVGIQIVDVRMKRTDLPDDNEQSVFNRMISERQSKAQEYLSKGDAEKRRIVAETDRIVKEMLATAKAKAEKIRGEGDQQAAKIYNESYSKDPEFYQLYRTLESYKRTINGETVIVLPANSPYARLLTGQID